MTSAPTQPGSGHSPAHNGSGRLSVVYLDHFAGLSGGELALARLLPALTEVDARVILAEDGPLVQRLTSAGIAVEVLPMAEAARHLRKDRISLRALPMGEAGSSLSYVVALARRLRALRPDLVHTNSLKSALYGGLAGRMAGIPVVWHIRDRIAPDYLPAGAVRLVRAGARLVPRAVIANSATTLATMPALPGRAWAIPSPVLLAARPVQPQAGDPQLRLAMVGRLAPWKGQHIFIQAFHRAFPEPGSARAVVVGSALFGEDEYGRELKELTTRLQLGNRIEFPGFLDGVAGQLAGNFDIVVHASVVPEPFGNVVLEGMAAGLAVVASGLGGPAELIEDGVNGLLYPPGDIAALARALQRLGADPELRRRLGQAAQASAADYSPDQIARRVMAVYRRALSPAP